LLYDNKKRRRYTLVKGQQSGKMKGETKVRDPSPTNVEKIMKGGFTGLLHLRKNL